MMLCSDLVLNLFVLFKLSLSWFLLTWTVWPQFALLLFTLTDVSHGDRCVFVSAHYACVFLCVRHTRWQGQRNLYNLICMKALYVFFNYIKTYCFFSLSCSKMKIFNCVSCMTSKLAKPHLNINIRKIVGKILKLIKLCVKIKLIKLLPKMFNQQNCRYL